MPFGFRYNGVHSSDMGIHEVTDVRRSILPPITARTITVPGRPGAYYQGRDYGMRAIEVDIVLDEASLSGLRTRVRQLAGWLQPGDDPRELVFDDEPEIAWKAVLSGDTDIEEIVATGRGTLTFLCPDPHAYSTTEKRRTIAAVSGTFARASVAYKGDGTQVSANEPRFETVEGRTGVLIEEGTTNLIRNSTGQGGGGSTLPTNWYVDADSGLSWSVNVADDVFAGHKYVDLTIQNTSGTTKNLRLYFEATDAIAASSGQTFVLSAILYVVNGSLPIQVGLGFHWYNSSKSYIGENKTTFSLSSTRSRYASSALTAPTNTAYARPRIDLYNIPNGASFTIRIVAPQAENKAYATSYVATTGTKATRAAETLTVPTAGVLNPQEGTVEAWICLLRNPGTNIQAIFDGGGTGTTGHFFAVDPATRKIYFQVGDGSSVIQCFGTTVVQPNTWYYVVATWTTSEIAIFVNGAKEGTKSVTPSIVFNSLAYVGSNLGMHRWLDGLIGHLRISNKARSDAEIAAAYAAGALTADEYTTALYTFDGTLAPTNNQTITNDGTAAAYPVIRAYVQRPTTFLAVATADRQIILGRPDSVEAATVEKETRILYDQLTTTTGWTTGTEVDGGVVTGTMYSDGADFRVQGYGTGSQWHGPSLKKSLSETLTDFRVTVWVTLKNRSGKVGRAEVYLLDQNGAVIGKMALVDRFASVDDVWAEVRAGSLSNGVYFVNTHGVRTGVWNDFYGVLQVERVGNVWRAYIGMFDTAKQQYHTRWTAQYVDVNNQFAAQLAQVQLHAATYGSATPCEVIFHAVVVDRINTVQKTQVPYIATAGDVLEIDCERATVRKNGMVDLSLLDVASRFPRLEPKTGTTFGVAPEDAAIVEVSFRERWL